MTSYPNNKINQFSFGAINIWKQWILEVLLKTRCGWDARTTRNGYFQSGNVCKLSI